MPEDNVLDLLDRVRQEYRNVRAIRRREPQEFLQRLEARSSILTKSGGQWLGPSAGEQPIWEFRHLTLQEYLAARALLDGRYPGRDRTKPLAEQVRPLAGSIEKASSLGIPPGAELQVAQSWQETLRLLVADCKDDDVDDVFRAIMTPLPAEDAEKTPRPRAVLAARCLIDEPNISEQMAEEVLIGLVAQISKGDGTGVNSTIMDTAVLEIARSLWAPALKALLLHQFCNRSADCRSIAGGLLAMAEMEIAPRDQAQFQGWYNRLAEQVDSSDEAVAAASALTISLAAFRRRVHRVPDLPASLLHMLSLSRPSAHAAAWALYWLSHVGPGGDKQPTWTPEEAQVLRLLSAPQEIVPAETSTRWWLVVDHNVSD